MQRKDLNFHFELKSTKENYELVFEEAVNSVKHEGRYRTFTDISRTAGNYPYAYDHIREKEIVIWCINDYLGMSQHPAVINAANTANSELGVGSGGTRNIGGTHHEVMMLEEELCDLHNKEASLVFTSGFVSNDATISTLIKLLPCCVVFSDEKNHASIIDGIRRNSADKYIYKHNNLSDLEEKLKHIVVTLS